MRPEPRLQVQMDGNTTWGYVCDDAFDANDNAARLVCKMLGKTGGVTCDTRVEQVIALCCSAVGSSTGCSPLFLRLR